MLEVEPTGHRGHVTSGSGKNGIESCSVDVLFVIAYHDHVTRLLTCIHAFDLFKA